MKMHERLPSSEDRGLHLWGLLVNDSSSDSENVYCFTWRFCGSSCCARVRAVSATLPLLGAWVTISARIVLE